MDRIDAGLFGPGALYGVDAHSVIVVMPREGLIAYAYSG